MFSWLESETLHTHTHCGVYIEQCDTECDCQFYNRESC